MNRLSECPISRLRYAALVVAALATPAAFGQSNPAAARDCVNITADTARLACYDRALRAESQTTARSTEPSASSQSSAGDRGADPRRARDDSADRDAGDDAREYESSRRADGNGEEGAVTVTVVEVRGGGARNESIFITDNGTVWLQTDARRVFLPEVPFTAEIRPGAFGSHFLEPADRGRPIRVREQ